MMQITTVADWLYKGYTSWAAATGDCIYRDDSYIKQAAWLWLRH